jgi:hypothetical protein
VRGERDRAQIQLVDVALSFFVLIALVALAPIMYEFIAMINNSGAGGLTSLVLALVVPMLFIGLIVSAAVSGR